MSTSYDVRIWAIRVRKDLRLAYQVRWKVGHGAPRHKSFATRALAESFRAELIHAMRRGEAFETETGLPESMLRQRNALTWYEHALDYIEARWSGAAEKSRISMVETLQAVTPVLTSDERGRPDDAILRRALRRWAFNPPRRDEEAPGEVIAALRWARRASLPMASLEDDRNVRQVLDVLARKLDGTPAAPDYFSRRRRVLYNVLRYAVAEKRLSHNPLDGTGWTRPNMDEVTEEINPRVVASPEQVRDLFAAVSYLGPRRGQRLIAFYACLYFGMLRPSEASGLRRDDCILPEAGWGKLDLADTRPAVGKDWTDSGKVHEHRGLKNRPRRATRQVPIPPELVVILRDHIQRHGVAPDGRLFRGESGGVLHPSSYSRTWRDARTFGLSPAQAASLLARRPYDLRHGGVSLRLNAGVPATQVAEWAGHSVEVLLTIYAKCIDGRDEVWFSRIDKALGGE